MIAATPNRINTMPVRSRGVNKLPSLVDCTRWLVYAAREIYIPVMKTNNMIEIPTHITNLPMR